MKIFIIEHQRDLLNSLENYLKSLNYEVMSDFDAVNAIINFDNSVDIVIIDKDITRTSYYSTILTFKRINPNVKIILLVDEFEVPLDLLINNKYINAFIARPFNEEVIKDAVENIEISTNSPFLSLKEEELYNALKTNEFISYQQIKDIFFAQGDVYKNYIKSLNYKLNNEQIINEVEGFKLVENNG